MKKNKIKLILGIVIGSISFAQADVTVINQVGVGARAFSMANNYVAAANDMSSIYWNPAALSFLPVREFQASLEMLSSTNTAELYGLSGLSSTKEQTDVRRLRFSNIGLLSAVPTNRGGLTFAAAFQSPYVFDDNPSFKGNYIDNNNNISSNSDYRSYGNLNFWSGAVGLQVAPGLGVGAALSLVSGSTHFKQTFLKLTNGIVADKQLDDFSYDIVRSYFGYDLRLGLLYSPIEKLRLGARMVLPQSISFSEDNAKGKIFSSFNGAIGASGTLPFATLSSEFRFRAPYDFVNPNDEIPSDNPAKYSRVGAGLGAEVPLMIKNLLLRLGYSWDQYDTYTFATQYEGDSSKVTWDANGITANQDRNLLTLGFAYVSESMSIETSYGYQFWKLDTKGTLNENNHIQRLLVSISTRF